MIRTRYALCAIRTIRDAEENRISVIDLVEDITVNSFPVLFPRWSLIWNLTREQDDPEEYQGSVDISQNGNPIFNSPLPVNFQGKHSTRSILVIGGISFEQPGQVDIAWSINGEVKIRYFFNIFSQPRVIDEQGS